MELTFLGTGGGRFTMLNQLRWTGGMYLEDDGFSLHIDPGPGALVHGRDMGVSFEELDAVVVTHAHPDHYSDMNAVVEAMTAGGTEPQGRLLVGASVVEGAAVPDRFTAGKGTYGDRIDPVLDSYHKALVEEVVLLEDEVEITVGPYKMTCIETRHSDPRTVAFTLDDGTMRAGFVSDTEYFEELPAFFAGCDVLVMNLMRPREKPWKGHLSTDDAAVLIDAVDPAVAVMQHFGIAIIRASVQEEMAWLREEVEAEVVAAEDGMTLDLEQPEQGLDRFLD